MMEYQLEGTEESCKKPKFRIAGEIQTDPGMKKFQEFQKFECFGTE